MPQCKFNVANFQKWLKHIEEENHKLWFRRFNFMNYKVAFSECDRSNFEMVDIVNTETDLAYGKQFFKIFPLAKQVLDEFIANGGTYDRTTSPEIHALVLSIDEHMGDAKERLNFIRNEIKEGKCFEWDAKAILMNHVIRRLITPDQSIGIDQKLEGKRKKETELGLFGDPYLRCGCHAYGLNCNNSLSLINTGFGHEEVWHGRADSFFGSLPVIIDLHVPKCRGTKKERPELSSDTSATLSSSYDEEPPAPKRARTYISKDASGKSKVKRKFSMNFEDKKSNVPIDIKRQYSVNTHDGEVSSTCITFSYTKVQDVEEAMAEKMRAEGVCMLIPAIMVNPNEFIFKMYDAINDVFISSNTIEINLADTRFYTTVIILWCVLNYKKFMIRTYPHAIQDALKNKRLLSGFHQKCDPKSLDVFKHGLKVGEPDIISKTDDDTTEPGSLNGFEEI